ncbi:hypothetical protein B0H21DRAFT_711363 [Amylocystis lapponica]|nr:hypothetical protein B0H21DRAFT_711363 [Amylocystis lapponica]
MPMSFSYRQSSTRRCLAIDEMFRCIVEELLDNGHGRGSVASLAATCQAFKEPSLAALWRNMDSIVPLLKLVDPDHWIEVRINGIKTFEFLLPYVPPMPRAPYYAGLVRSFEWNSNLDVDLDTLKIFVQNPKLQTVFPNLRYLNWSESRPLVFPWVTNFFGPRVRTIFLDSELGLSDPNRTMGVCYALEERCKELETLSLARLPNHPGVDSKVAWVLGQSSFDLKEFFATRVEPASLVALSKMQRLASLTVGLTCATLHSPLVNATSQLDFAALETLQLDLDFLDEASLALFRAIQAPVLHSLALEVTHQPTAYVLQLHLDALAHAPFAKTLGELVLFFTDVDADVTPDTPSAPFAPSHIVTARTLRPLLGMRQLEGLDVRTPRMDVAPDFLQTCAQTFAAAEALALLPSVHGSGSRCAPLEALAAFAEHCPRLLSLGLCVDATRVPAGRVSESCLAALTVCDAPIGEPEEVAGFLVGLFPGLKLLSHCCPALEAGEDARPEEYVRREGWKLVHDRIVRSAP